MLKRTFAISSIAVLTLLVAPPVFAQEAIGRVNEMIAGKRYSEAERAIQKQFNGKLEGRDADIWKYLSVLVSMRSGDAQKALERVDEILKEPTLLEEDFRNLRAEALEALKKYDEMVAEDLKLLSMDPNFLLKSQANLRIGRTYLRKGKARDARKIFVSLEKRARGTPEHPDVMIELARTEMQLKNSAASCRWLRRLYRQHPTHPATVNWGPDLAASEFDGKKTGCSNTKAEFRDRLRALLFAGEEERARKEVHEVAGAFAEEDRITGDELRAWFLLQSGYPDEAYQLLEPSAPKKKNDADFLSVFATAAARSGNSNAAVGAYHRIWELSPNRERGRKALYQSAFLSYQFRDYDGASRRFNEFIKKYPRSGLSRDARWNLAWITYLKGDFKEARRRFEDISKSRGGAALREKARYWIAMTYLREEEPQKAREELENIANSKSGSYYGLLAKQRLMNLPEAQVAVSAEDSEPKLQSSYGHFRAWGPVGATTILQAATDGWTLTTLPDEEPVSEENESEATLAAETEASDEGALAETSTEEEEAISDLVQETGRSEVVEEPVLVKSPANSRRFERARMLIALNQIDEARWELYEIERKTKSKDELRLLISLYEEAGQWHRSSSIAHLRFASQRLNQGMTAGRDLWMSAYPQAYASAVNDSAKRYQLPSEFIWGLMRAESRYRRDAVSPVGAMGLMQIMPGTARKVADLMGKRSFSPQQLLQPEVAVQMGSYYLRRLSNQFGNSLPLTAAAYNAGPHRVHSWLLSFGGLDYDEFIEHIPFLETREYVRRVIANSMIYAELYGGNKEMVDLVGPVKAKGRAELSKKENWEPM